MNKVFYYIFLFTAFSFFNLKAHSTMPKNGIDSILRIVDKAEGEERLKLLDQYISDYAYDLNLVRKLEQEADSQENHLYKSVAYKGKLFNFTKEKNRDSIRHYLTLMADEIALLEDKKSKMSSDENEKLIVIRKKLINIRSMLNIAENKHNLVIADVKKILRDSKNNETNLSEEEAYYLLGAAYLKTKNAEEAISSFRKSYSRSNFKIGNYEYYDALEGIGVAYGGLKQYKNAMLITDTLINRIEEEYQNYRTVQEITTEDRFQYNFLKNRAMSYLALWNIKMGEAKISRKLLDDVKEFILKASYIDATHPGFELYYMIEAEYNLLTKKFDKAKEYVNLIIDKTSIVDQSNTYLSANYLLADILNEEGKSEEAFILMSKLYRLNDSISAVSFSKEVAELQAVHEVDTTKMLIAQRDAELKNTRIILCLVVFALLSFVVVSYVVWKNGKIVIVKNKKLYDQYKEILKRNEKIDELQLSKERVADEYVDNQDVFEKIMNSLETYLKESEAFRDTELSREELAQQIGTNRQYLIEAIKEKTGKTFNEYIYSYRLNLAYNLLVSNENMTVTEISQEVGFHSRGTFYKAFKDTYGMTPSELRSILSGEK